ncbi:MAG TPA: hypothetical protein VFU36_10705 [Jatrophihabitans sp.]|nr:hypothetical protein [Jatrophihabitans sp.]
MRVRWLAAAALCALGALTLAGCDSKIGTAAEVNGSKISESDVSRYLDPAASDASQARSTALQYQIEQKLLTVALRNKNALPSDAELAKRHDQALSGLFNGQLSGSKATQALGTVLAQNGLKASFGEVLIRTVELEQSFTDAIHASGAQQAVAELTNQHIPVSVNPRYGSWNTGTFSFTGLANKQLPSVVTLGTTLPGDVQPSNSQ